MTEISVSLLSTSNGKTLKNQFALEQFFTASDLVIRVEKPVHKEVRGSNI
jgi:hypothetical protein